MSGWGLTNRPAPTLTNAVFRGWGGMTGVKNMIQNAQRGGQYIMSPHGNGDESRFVEAVRVTVEEAAALQTYPPDFEFAGNKGSIGLQIGNAVPPLLAQVILEELWS